MLAIRQRINGKKNVLLVHLEVTAFMPNPDFPPKFATPTHQLQLLSAQVQ